MNSSKLQQLGVTRGRLITIAILAMVLIGVLVFQMSSSPTSHEAPLEIADRADGSPRPAETPATVLPEPKRSTTAASHPTTAWPSFELDEVLQNDPFELPLSLGPSLRPSESASLDKEPAEPARQAASLQRLQAEGVDLVVVTTAGPVAKIGSRKVREGDTIEGYRVSKIDATGVTLSMMKDD